jgi:hypothetical protein
MAVAVGLMTYVPDWERLFDALKRVIAAGVSADEAKLAICHAIADRKIQVRLTLDWDANPEVRWNRMVLEAKKYAPGPNNTSTSLEFFQGADIGVPSHLTPHDFDWEHSRPLKLWSIRPRESQIEPRDWKSIEGHSFVWPRRIVSRIEACTADVTRLIGEITKPAHGGIASETTSSAPSHAVAQSTLSMSRDDAADNGASLLERDSAPAPAPARKRKRRSSPQRDRALREIGKLFPGDVPDQATLSNKCLCKLVNNSLKKQKVSNDTILRAAGRRPD